MAKVGSSAKFGVLVFKASMLYSLGVHQPKYVHLPSLVYWYSRHLCSIHWVGSIAKVCSSAKFGVLVFKASILYSHWGGPLAKVGLSAKFGVLVFKASILDSLGGPLAKVGSSAKFGVLVFKASILNSLGGGPLAKVGSSAKFGVAGIQGIYS